MEENKIPQEDLSEEDYAQSNPAFAKYLAWKRRMQERGKWNPNDPAHQWRVIETALDRIAPTTPSMARRLRTLYVELLVLRKEAGATCAVLRKWSGLDLADDNGRDADRAPANLLAALADVVADVHESVADIAGLIGEEEDADGRGMALYRLRSTLVGRR